MARNRKKHNALPFGSMAPVIVIVIFLGFTGVCYVGFKTQMHLTGSKIKLLERELSDLSTQNEVLRAQTSSLASRRQLQRHLDSGFITMVPITNDRIVRLNDRGAPTYAAEMRAVSNEVIRR